MLNDEEEAEIRVLVSECVKAVKEFREKWAIPLNSASVDERFAPVRLRYQELTGMEELPQECIMHHYLSLYGPPCARCGKPLRTPKAKLCGACMWPVAVTSSGCFL